MDLWAARLMVYGGACVLLSALIPIRRLYQCLLPGKVRLIWLMLLAMTVLFVAGYCLYGVTVLEADLQPVDLIVPGIFFLGSIFVLLSSLLSLRTAQDVRKMAALEQENITDALTGIYNRKYLERRLQEEFTRVKRYQLPLSVLLIDMDHFKVVNDSYGHLAGDHALALFTQLLLQTVRPTDIVARWGGDEFMVIATHTSGPEAYQLAEKIRQSAEENELKMAGGDNRTYSARVTVSIGVACSGSKFESVPEFVESVDQMMYRAKEEGRNRTLAWEDCHKVEPEPVVKPVQYTL